MTASNTSFDMEQFFKTFADYTDDFTLNTGRIDSHPGVFIKLIHKNTPFRVYVQPLPNALCEEPGNYFVGFHKDNASYLVKYNSKSSTPVSKTNTETISEQEIINHSLPFEIAIERLFDTINAFSPRSSEPLISNDQLNNTETRISDNRATIHTDGASRGNPGHSAIGYKIDTDNTTITNKEYIGDDRTNNEAEYYALRSALATASKENISQIKIFTDSKLLAKQLNGEWDCNSSKLKQELKRIKNYLADMDWAIEHISREYNTTADALANEALNEELGA